MVTERQWGRTTVALQLVRLACTREKSRRERESLDDQHWPFCGMEKRQSVNWNGIPQNATVAHHHINWWTDPDNREALYMKTMTPVSVEKNCPKWISQTWPSKWRDNGNFMSSPVISVTTKQIDNFTNKRESCNLLSYLFLMQIMLFYMSNFSLQNRSKLKNKCWNRVGKPKKAIKSMITFVSTFTVQVDSKSLLCWAHHWRLIANVHLTSRIIKIYTALPLHTQ